MNVMVRVDGVNRVHRVTVEALCVLVELSGFVNDDEIVPLESKGQTSKSTNKACWLVMTEDGRPNR